MTRENYPGQWPSCTVGPVTRPRLNLYGVPVLLRLAVSWHQAGPDRVTGLAVVAPRVIGSAWESPL